MTDRVFTFIDSRDRLGLERFLSTGLTLPLVDLVDSRGYTALHLAAFKGFDDIAETVIGNVKATINPSELKLWVNLKTVDDGFTALHFASFRGNITIIQALLDNGADMYARNNFGINVMHVAA